jgi:hypothetical protein
VTNQPAPYLIDFDLVLLDLENSDIAAVSFQGNKKKKMFLEGSWTPIKMNILFWFLQN